MMIHAKAISHSPQVAHFEKISTHFIFFLVFRRAHKLSCYGENFFAVCSLHYGTCTTHPRTTQNKCWFEFGSNDGIPWRPIITDAPTWLKRQTNYEHTQNTVITWIGSHSIDKLEIYRKKWKKKHAYPAPKVHRVKQQLISLFTVLFVYCLLISLILELLFL